MRRFLPLVLLVVLAALPARGQGNRLYLEVGRTVTMYTGDFGSLHHQTLWYHTAEVDDDPRAAPLLGFGVRLPMSAHVDAVAGLQGGGIRTRARGVNPDGWSEGEGALRFVGSRFRLELRTDDGPLQVFMAFGLGSQIVHIEYERDTRHLTGFSHDHLKGTAFVASREAVVGLRQRVGRLSLSAEAGYRVGRSDYLETDEGAREFVTRVGGNLFLLRAEVPF